jgi:hypothetical protein
MRAFAMLSITVLAVIATGVTVVGPSVPRPSTLSSLSLPRGWSVSEIGDIAGHPTLFGTRVGTAPSEPCARFTLSVDPLRLGSAKIVSCDAGVTPGGQVAPDVEFVRGSG